VWLEPPGPPTPELRCALAAGMGTGERQEGRWRRSSPTPGIGVGVLLGAAIGFLLRDLLPFEMASAWVPFAVVGALVWPAGLRRTLIALAATTALVWIIVAFTPVTRRLAPLLIREERPRSADAVFVLASRLQPDGDPTVTAQARLLHGLELLAQGFATRLVLTELPPPAPSHAELARRQMERLRLKPAEILSLGHVRSTREEAQQVGELCRQRGWRRLVVVSTPLHSRRACGAVEREGVAVVCSPARETEYDLATLGRPTERLPAFRHVVRELLALMVYQRRGWLPARTSRNDTIRPIIDSRCPRSTAV
jgi:uncharacterized SAM-binding protein YcdF (DUF218 family)